jgi:hypothetical protein
MKKKIILGIVICTIATFNIVNFYAIGEYVHGNVSLESLSIMSKAYAAELPEVTITCSSGKDGACFAEGAPHHYIGVFGLPMCETTCYFTGHQSDFCASGMPC